LVALVAVGFAGFDFEEDLGAEDRGFEKLMNAFIFLKKRNIPS